MPATAVKDSTGIHVPSKKAPGADTRSCSSGMSVPWSKRSAYHDVPPVNDNPSTGSTWYSNCTKADCCPVFQISPSPGSPKRARWRVVLRFTMLPKLRSLPRWATQPVLAVTDSRLCRMPLRHKGVPGAAPCPTSPPRTESNKPCTLYCPSQPPAPSHLARNRALPCAPRGLSIKPSWFMSKANGRAEPWDNSPTLQRGLSRCAQTALTSVRAALFTYALSRKSPRPSWAKPLAPSAKTSGFSNSTLICPVVLS